MEPQRKFAGRTAKKSNGSTADSHELQTFLPNEESKAVINISDASAQNELPREFDPFAERNLPNPTSDMDTLTHLLKASLGTGILAMPKAFKCAGYVTGVFFTMLVATICTHCAYLLIKCAHVLYKKLKVTKMSFPELAEAALSNGPRWARPWAKPFRIFIVISLFVTYFGTCSVYTVIVGKNISQVVLHYLPDYKETLDIRVFILLLLVPFVFMAWIRDLKYLAPVSWIANVFMMIGLGITLYYLVGVGSLDLDAVSPVKSPVTWPEFFSLSIFAIEAIGVVMPLENAMKTPRSLLGVCGVLSKGMTGVTIVYILLGFLGYLRFGEDVADSVNLNLDQNDILAQIVQLSISIAVYCTFGLQFFVCVDITWESIKDKCTRHPEFAQYAMRTVLATGCVLLAILVPTIAPFMSVIGAFCFSLLGLIAPAFIDLMTFWEIGYGKFNYLFWKDVFLMIFGFFALVLGSKDAIISIVKVYNE